MNTTYAESTSKAPTRPAGNQLGLGIPWQTSQKTMSRWLYSKLSPTWTRKYYIQWTVVVDGQRNVAGGWGGLCWWLAVVGIALVLRSRGKSHSLCIDHIQLNSNSTQLSRVDNTQHLQRQVPQAKYSIHMYIHIHRCIYRLRLGFGFGGLWGCWCLEHAEERESERKQKHFPNCWLLRRRSLEYVDVGVH